ncbi:MAG TPA: hypothetical protein VNK41_01435 [Vicinamibacterales bacterium]|nr:hypothetical protein [Vicinamibacterales bacterium]
MKLLFFVRHWAYLRNFESAIDELAARGHTVHLAADVEEALGGRQMVERLVARHPGRLSMGPAPGRALGAWADLARRIRHALDYLRFLEPRYAATPHLAARARERAPRSILALLELPWFRTERGRTALARALRALERGLPCSRELVRFIADHRPDAVLITPLVDLGSRQLDHLQAARALGVRTILPVGSWDHLSSKALLRQPPDAVLVWNEVQKREAIEMHGVPAERVIVTGAQCYDQWWSRRPSRTREAFCARVGLRVDRPFVLYVCSSLFRGTADEPMFVLDWIRAVRSSHDPRLKDVGLLIRPHPARLKEWAAVDFSGYRNVAFWGAHPVDDESKDDYFDSMYYSSAVVGLNTSAFIEAAVVGKPVHTVLLPDISAYNQEGTIHFHYLLTVGGGLLRIARSFEEHTALLADSLAGEGGGDSKAERFAEAFVRPYGAGAAATPRFVDAIERAVSAPPPARERASAAALLRVPLYPLVVALALHLRTQLWRKHVRNAVRKRYQALRRGALMAMKQIAARGLRKARTPSGPAALPGALTPKPGRHRDPAKRAWMWGVEEADEVREIVTLLGRSGDPIVAGPWLSETGFELLYWIPFLAWAKTYGNIDAERLVVVSRGGAAPWYAGLTPQYEEIFGLYTVEEFRHRNEERIAAQQGRLKHTHVSPFDKEIVDRVVQKRGLRGARLLHPSLMYRLFDHFWFQRTPVTLVEAFTRFSKLPVSDGASWPLRSVLPERYVAAKFYGNTALPDTPENRAFVAGLLGELAQQIDVVLLNTADRFDDHEDFPSMLRGRLHSIEHLMRPEDNLAVQTEVIRHASAFIGTYGGFSYLAPLVGTDTVAFYSHPSGFRFDHLEVAKRVFAGLRCGAFVEMDTRAVDAVRLAFGRPLPLALESR